MSSAADKNEQRAEDARKRLEDLLREAQQPGSFGKFSLTIPTQNGKIQRVTETRKRVGE